MKRLIALGTIAAVVVGGYLYWQNRSAARAAAAAGEVRYVAMVARKGDIRMTVQGSGPITAQNGLMVRANVAGTVEEILVSNGTSAAAGQPLVILSNDSLGASLQQAQLDLDSAMANLQGVLNPSETSVRAAELKVQNAELTVRLRQEEVEGLQVTAGATGLVMSVPPRAGADIAANGLLLTIWDDSAPTFTMNVSQKDAPYMKLNQQVKVTLPGYDPMEGTVLSIGNIASPAAGSKDAMVPIKVALPAASFLRPGMVGNALVMSDPFAVPGAGAIDGDLHEVRVKVAGTIERIDVGEGARVQAGDRVAVMTNESLKYQLALAENDLATQRQSLAGLMDPFSDPQSNVRTLRQKVDQSILTLKSRQEDVDNLQVAAPVPGTVSGMTLRVGDRVSSGQQLFRVADYRLMQVTIMVDELDIARVRPGAGATITLDALPGRAYTGKVLHVNPEGIFRNDIATFEVTVAIENPQGLLAGMNSSVEVVVEEKENVLWVPAQALRVQQGRTFVRTCEASPEQGQAGQFNRPAGANAGAGAAARQAMGAQCDPATEPQEVEVSIGVRTSTQVEVTGGLQEGQMVVVTEVRSGQQTAGFGSGAFQIPGGPGGFGGGFGGGGQRPIPGGGR